MKRSLISVFVPLLFFCVAAQASDDETAPASALVASREWLALVDAGDYAKSWDNAAALFKNQVTKSTWESAAGVARAPLGALKERKVDTVHIAQQLPGAPDGEYVVITYRSSFANQPDAVETVTPMRDTDGQWRVVGYFVK